jgi:hypothetical protein
VTQETADDSGEQEGPRDDQACKKAGYGPYSDVGLPAPLCFAMTNGAFPASFDGNNGCTELETARDAEMGIPEEPVYRLLDRVSGVRRLLPAKEAGIHW